VQRCLNRHCFAQGDNVFAAWDQAAWISMLFQSVVVAFASYLAWFWLMRRYLASRLSAFSFLTPLFGVAAGVVLMNDVVSPRFAIGADGTRRYRAGEFQKTNPCAFFILSSGVYRCPSPSSVSGGVVVASRVTASISPNVWDFSRLSAGNDLGTCGIGR
jgi:hypothetical protein